MKNEKLISGNSIFTVVAVAKEKNSNGAYAREYLKEVKDNLTDSARLLVNGILPKKKSRKNAPESGK